MKWWHGRGSFIDYSNPDAVNWWHKQLDNVLILNQTDPKEGIDGWVGNMIHFSSCLILLNYSLYIQKRNVMELTHMSMNLFTFMVKKVTSQNANMLTCIIETFSITPNK